MRQGTHDTRAPGPESAPVNTPERWRSIIHRCVINERTSLLASISRLFDRPTETAQAHELERFLDDLIEFWKKAEFRNDQLVDPRVHYCAFSFRFPTSDGATPHYQGTLPNLRRLIEETSSSAGNESDIGWELFGINKVNVRPTIALIDNTEGYQAVITPRENGALVAPAFWRVNQDGRGGEVRGYHEDSWWLCEAVEQKRGPGSWLPGRFFSPSLEERRMYQFVWIAYQLSQNFENATKVEFAIEFAGLANRVIKDPEFGVHYSVDRKSSENKRRILIESSPEALASEEGKAEAAARLLAPVGRLFDGWEIAPQSVAGRLRQRVR